MEHRRPHPDTAKLKTNWFLEDGKLVNFLRTKLNNRRITTAAEQVVEAQ